MKNISRRRTHVFCIPGHTAFEKAVEDLEEFSCSTKILAGAGAISGLAALKAKRLFLVSDPFFVKNGLARKVAEAAKADCYEIFDRVQPDPTVALAAEGTAALKRFEPDLIVALGGGSAMDLAKALTFFARGDYTFVAIPTTSGSGSEVTDFAILTHEKIKHPLVDKRLRPDIAILDSDLLAQLPRSLVADAGFDVIAHALESYVATNAGCITDCFARESFCVAFANLPASYAGRTDVRLKVHMAATMAGMAFTQAGLGLCHAISHALGGMYHVPHGRLNAILLPAVIECNAMAAMGKYARIARAAGIGGSVDSVAVRNLRNSLCRLRRDLDLPQTLVQAGVDQRRIWQETEAIVSAALADPCCETNPIPPEPLLVRKILDGVTGRV